MKKDHKVEMKHKEKAKEHMMMSKEMPKKVKK